MQCRYCAGAGADETMDIPWDWFKESEGITGFILIYQYPERFDIEHTYWHQTWLGKPVLFEAGQTAIFTHIKSGAVIEAHRCFEQGKVLFKASGSGMWNAREIEVFADFFRRVIRQEEGRGQGRRKDVTTDQVLDAIEREPNANGASLALALSVSERTISARLKPLGGLRRARRLVKNRQTKK